MSVYLDKVNLPQDIKNLSDNQLKILAGEIRDYLIKTVSQNGGHLATNLGVVELTLSLHQVFDLDQDKVIWDVGHQCYTHKLLTGRKELLKTLRQKGGISGFPKREESAYDHFNTGHSSTSLSVALGIAKARDLLGKSFHVIAVIGDGALTGGVALEALNHAGELKTSIIVVLNDNKMSISPNVGGLASYLSRLRSDPKYFRLKEDIEFILHKIPRIGPSVARSAEKIKDSLKYLLVPGLIFEELGFTYLGPVDGHNISALKQSYVSCKNIKGPVLLHVLTKKGQGYKPAENEPKKYHGVGPFDISSGKTLKKSLLSYTAVFSRALLRQAEKNKKIVAITAAMPEGTGLEAFSKKFPDRFFDVGIAEQHAVTMAAGLAVHGMKPVVAIYSTFLQRAFDQLVHDIALQKLPVVFAIDRAGVVGEDGETHQGLLDLSYLGQIPGFVVMAPKDGTELEAMLEFALSLDEPVAIRYPKGDIPASLPLPAEPVKKGKAELLREGDDLLILALGSTVNSSYYAAEQLALQGLHCAVINARFMQPLDEELILKWAKKCGRVLTIEEHQIVGGFGHAFLGMLERRCIYNIEVKRMGLATPFIEHGPRNIILQENGLDQNGIYKSAYNFILQGRQL